jgi:hypothetical protein
MKSAIKKVTIKKLRPHAWAVYVNNIPQGDVFWKRAEAREYAANLRKATVIKLEPAPEQ